MKLISTSVRITSGNPASIPRTAVLSDSIINFDEYGWKYYCNSDYPYGTSGIDISVSGNSFVFSCGYGYSGTLYYSYWV